jgi:hypothetical protein
MPELFAVDSVDSKKPGYGFSRQICEAFAITCSGTASRKGTAEAG